MTAAITNQIIESTSSKRLDRPIRQLKPEQRQVFFHLHIDAAKVFPQALENELLKIGFKADHFNGAPEDSGTIVPAAHYTKVYNKDKVELLRHEQKVVYKLLNSYNIPSYVEAEIISSEWRGDNFYKNPSGLVSEIPFQLVKRKLFGAPNDCFKQAELHVEMKLDSNPELLKQLQASGFMPILWEDEIIFTAQGDDTVIHQLEKVALQYIEEQGGAKDLHIIVEIMAPHGYSYHGGYGYQSQPSIVSAIHIENNLRFDP